MQLEDEKTIPLRKPITTAKGEVTELVLREPTGAEFNRFTREAAKGDSFSAMMTLIALVAGIDKPFIEKIGIRDLQAASDYLTGFINASPETGETASPT